MDGRIVVSAKLYEICMDYMETCDLCGKFSISLGIQLVAVTEPGSGSLGSIFFLKRPSKWPMDLLFFGILMSCPG